MPDLSSEPLSGLLLRNNLLESRGMYSPISRSKIVFILLILAGSLLRIGGSREGVKGVATPLLNFKNKRE